MRLATYNILHGRAVSDSASHLSEGTADDPELLLRAIHQLNADIIGLQEVDKFQPRSRTLDQTRLIAESLAAADWRFVPTVIGTPGGRLGFRSATHTEILESATTTATPPEPEYGISLISRYPVSSWRVKVFPPAPFSLPLMVQSDRKPQMVRVRDEQRAAIAAQIDSPRGRLTVVTAHLSFVPGFNVRQLRRLRAWIADMPRPLILMGDFNLPGSVPRTTSRLTELVTQPTFPSYRPRIQFDHIMADGFEDLAVEHMRASVRTWATGVSDHCAVTVDVPPLPPLLR